MITPKNAEVYLIYECPSCHCEWTKTVKEVKLLGGMVCGGCDTYSKFEPIIEVRVTPVYAKQQAVRPTERVEKVKEVSILSPMKEDAVSALISLGYHPKESRLFVMNNECNTLEEYIVKAVSNVNTRSVSSRS